MKQYKEGTFGYYWTVELGNEDIGGIDYDGNIDANDFNGDSLDGMPSSVGGGVDLRSYNGSTLVGLPNSVCGYLLLRSYNGSSLEGLPDIVEWSLYLQSYKGSSLIGLPVSIDGELNLRSYNGSALIGLPKYVGWNLYLQSYNGESIPDDIEVGEDIYAKVHRYKGKLTSFFGGIQKEVKTSRTVGSNAVYEMVDGTFAVYDGKHFAHGSTLEEAQRDLLFKRS